LTFTILIIGGSGRIGSKLIDYFSEKNVETKYTFCNNEISLPKGFHLDITKKRNTIDLITKINPNVVIHTASLVDADLCETNHSLADLINVKGTENVIEGCKITNSKLVYISTSFVFDGTKDLYFEECSTCPTTYYGITKLRAENLVLDSSLKFLILRTDQPYCWIEKWQKINSVLRVLRTLGSGKELKEITDWLNSPTYVPDLVNVVDKLVEKNLTGIYHTVGSDYISRFDWAIQTAKTFGLDIKMLKPIPSEELNLPAKRDNIRLSNQKTFEKTGIRMMGVEEGMLQMLKIRKSEFFTK